MADTQEEPQSRQENTEVVDLHQSMHRALGNPVITDRILFHLSVSDVLRCSLVNHFWRSICRRYLRCGKGFEITLKFDDISSQMQNLNKMLMNATDLPFNGVKLVLELEESLKHINKICDPWKESNNDIVTLYSSVFQKLPMKTLRIDFSFSFGCVCESVLKKLLITRAHGDTEYLDIIRWPRKVQSLWEYLNTPEQLTELTTTLRPSNIFQSLQTFQLRYEDLFCFEKFISEIIMSSPELKNFYGPLPGGFFAESSLTHYGFPRSKLHVIRDVVVSSQFGIAKLLEIKPKLEHLGFDPGIFYVNNRRGESEIDARREDEVKKDLGTIIENCSNSLVKLVSNNSTHLLHQIMNISLTNCVIFELLISPSYRGFHENLLFLQAINYQAYLPNLRRLDLEFDEKHCVDHITKEKQIKDRSSLYKRAKFTCFSVKELFIRCSKKIDFQKKLQPEWIAVADVFPNVKALHVGAFGRTSEIVGNVGLPWKENLESLSCFLQERSTKSCLALLTELLESLCCDISSEELLTVNCSKFSEWSYAPTRRQLIKNRGRSSIAVSLDHNFCKEPPGPWPDKLRFDHICSWIQTKMPRFSIALMFNRCHNGKSCNPIPFYTGRIGNKYSCRGTFFGAVEDFQTWYLNF